MQRETIHVLFVGLIDHKSQFIVVAQLLQDRHWIKEISRHFWPNLLALLLIKSSMPAERRSDGDLLILLAIHLQTTLNLPCWVVSRIYAGYGECFRRTMGWKKVLYNVRILRPNDQPNIDWLFYLRNCKHYIKSVLLLKTPPKLCFDDCPSPCVVLPWCKRLHLSVCVSLGFMEADNWCATESSYTLLQY